MTCSAGSGEAARRARTTEARRPAGPVPPDGQPAEPSDLALLRAHVAGNQDAFGRLFQRHRDRLWAVAVRTVADREDAADALQDAMLSAYRAADRFRGDAAVTTWLHRIVVNACLDRIRRRQAHPTVPLPDGSRVDGSSRWTASTEPAAPQPDHETALVVREALAALPVEQRAALVLVDVQGYPVAEVAEMLGVAEGTVKSRCARGRARLARLLGDLGAGRPGNQRSAKTEPPAPAPAPAPASSLPRSTRQLDDPAPAVRTVTTGNPRQGIGVPSMSTPGEHDQPREEP